MIKGRKPTKVEGVVSLVLRLPGVGGRCQAAELGKECEVTV